MPANDVKDLEFLVFQKNNKGKIVGVVKFDPKLTQEFFTIIILYIINFREINYFD